MKPKGPKAYGLYELCELVGHPQNNRVRLRAKLPPPDAELKMGPVWLARTVDRWLKAREAEQ
jgi:hypothetical protein